MKNSHINQAQHHLGEALLSLRHQAAEINHALAALREGETDKDALQGVLIRAGRAVSGAVSDGESAGLALVYALAAGE